MGLQLSKSALRQAVLDPSLQAGSALGTQLEPGDCIVLRPRRVLLDLSDIDSSPAAEKVVEGPYVRFTPLRENNGIGTGECPVTQPWQVKVGDSQAWADSVGANQTTTVSSSVDNVSGAYWELDALANVPFICPTRGSWSWAVGENGAWFFDGFVFRASGRRFQNCKAPARQTRYVAPNSTRDLYVPMGAFAFEVQPSVNMPTLSLVYDDALHASGTVSSSRLLSLATYNVGNLISTGNARMIRVVAAAGEPCTIVFHIAMPELSPEAYPGLVTP